MAIEVTNATALDTFVAKARALFAAEQDLEERWTKLTPILAELLADPAVQRSCMEWPECTPRDGRAENLLFYEDPDFGFAINGLVKSGGRPRGNIHDHAHIYTLYGVLDGHERVERYERLDDGSVPDRAEVRLSGELAVGPGEIDLVRPYEIHTEVTVGERTVAVIVRSQRGGDFDQGHYELGTNRYWASPGPRQTPAEMFPKP